MENLESASDGSCLCDSRSIFHSTPRNSPPARAALLSRPLRSGHTDMMGRCHSDVTGGYSGGGGHTGCDRGTRVKHLLSSSRASPRFILTNVFLVGENELDSETALNWPLTTAGLAAQPLDSRIRALTWEAAWRRYTHQGTHSAAQ